MKNKRISAWEKTIMGLSEMMGSACKGPIMAYPWNCPNKDYSKDSHKECRKMGYVCHCDDGILCEHRAKWLVSFIRRLLKKQREEIERLTIQLAGCSVAALGGTKSPAKQSDWGWSRPYQDVLDLRKNFDSTNKWAKKNGLLK